jgi:hypothetical protein
VSKYTVSFYVRQPHTPSPRWWHRLLRVEPRAVWTWARKHFTTEFPTNKDATDFATVLLRPEVIRGLFATPELPQGGQVESTVEPTPYIQTGAATAHRPEGSRTNLLLNASEFRP